MPRKASKGSKYWLIFYILRGMKKYVIAFVSVSLFAVPGLAFGQVAGADKQIQFNNAGSLSGDTNFTWDMGRSMLKISNNTFFPAAVASTSGIGFRVEGTQITGGSIQVAGKSDPSVSNGSNQGVEVATLFAPTRPDKIYYGVFSIPAVSGSQKITSVTGVFSGPHSRSVPPGTQFSGQVQDVIAYDAQPQWNSGTVTNLYGYKTTQGMALSKVENMYGLSIADVTLGSNSNYAIKTGLGKVEFGDKVTTKNGLNISKIPTGSAGSKSASCVVGDITWDDSYIYLCVSSGKWKKAVLTE